MSGKQNRSPVTPAASGRQLAWQILRYIDRTEAYADLALDRFLRQTDLPPKEQRLATELVYGITRRCRTLDSLIDHLCPKPADRQPPDLRRLLHLGLYQLRYLDLPPALGVDSTVSLARGAKLGRLSGVVNGVLRSYLRQEAPVLPTQADPIRQLAIQESFPDWLVSLWVNELGLTEATALCQWFNQVPSLDLRVNQQRATVAQVQAAFEAAGIALAPWGDLPHALRLQKHQGAVSDWPGYQEGWWSIQDASAQAVVPLLDPQPHDVVLDACAAPGGKATYLAEWMGDQGVVWAGDRHAQRLNRVVANAQRLGLTSLRPCPVDWLDPATYPPDLPAQVDRLLLDVPCSGLGTLHRHADARWRQTPETVAGLVTLQAALLAHTAPLVKPGGTLVYATCTLHPAENQAQIDQFLAQQPQWQLVHPPQQVWPHRQQQDGFFMAKLQRQA